MLEQESLVATLGLAAATTGTLPKFTLARAKSAESVIEYFEKAASKFAALKKPAPFPETTVARNQFDKIVQDLNKEIPPEYFAKELDQYPDDIAVLVESQLVDNRYYLQAQIPTQVPFGSFNMTLLEPSDSDKARFMWQCNLIDRPERFADLFLAGALTTVETALMRALYPALFDVLLFAVIDEIIDAVDSNNIASWEGGWKRLAMSNLLGVQVDSFQNVLAWQTGFEEKTAGRPPNPGRIELAEANQTDLQKTQAR
jgi:hypothetical protein